jgi:hypothetical protein
MTYLSQNLGIFLLQTVYIPHHAAQSSLHLSSNGDLNLNTGIDVDDDLLDDLGGGVEARNNRLA